MTRLQLPVRLYVVIVQGQLGIMLSPDNNNVCTHMDLITTLLQGCLKTLHIDLFVFSGTGDVSSIGGNGNGQEFTIMQEWVTHLLIGLKAPDTNGVIRRCADKMEFIRGQTDGSDRVGMTAKNNELFAINGLPFSNSHVT
jgi:hypothetical protein